jgi:hypothetical protein
MYRKNVAGQFITFQLISTTDGSAITGVSPAVRRCIDGTFAAGGGTVTEDTGGYYKYAMSQADTNGNNIGFRFSGTGAITVALNIVTTAADPTDTVRFGLTAMPNVASGNAGALLVDGTGTAAISNSSGKVLLQATQSGVTIPTVTTVTNQLTAAQIATGVWTDTTAGDFTTALSVGKSVMNGVSLGTGLTIAAVSGAVGSVTGAVGSVTGAVGSVTGNVGGNVTGSIGSLAAQAKADVNAEVVDTLATDTYAEPGQGAPAATASLSTKLNWLYKAWRNKKDNDGTTTNLYNDDGSTVGSKQATSEAAGTVTAAEWITGA